jgi:DNA helicase II / ATP-dependent DNA helicase PcrA
MKSSERRLLALCRKEKFEPDPNQKRAIFHVNGPLYLPAGPGAGKTGVLLWRALNLILFHEVKPDQIFLATFTEKAALRLRDGLQGLLVESDSCFDISSMYVGTVHALCRRLIEDRRFSPDRVRPRAPELLDELGQLLYVYKHWKELLASAGLTSGAEESINNIFDSSSSSRYEAAAKCITFFNRLSEECVDPAIARHRSRDEGLLTLLDLYEAYRRSLRQNTDRPLTDFSLLQQEALRVLERSSSSKDVFQHIIIDEYQDTNAVQERLFFKLAEGRKNLCVVGDDDQSLYRFRGATVQNFVEFPARCRRNLRQSPVTIPLGTNYRSRRKIVEFNSDFIERFDWSKAGRGAGHTESKIRTSPPRAPIAGYRLSPVKQAKRPSIRR